MNGALIVDKPPDMTSHTVVAHVRRIVGTRRVGHTGTLDPFATGVLVVLVGKATRLLQFLSGAAKEYEAIIRFGYATDTGDLTGKRIEDSVTTRSASELAEAEILSAIASLSGQIEQVPPMYSAKKIKGQKLYELARRGEEVAREPVRVSINAFEPVKRDGRLVTMNDDGSGDLAVRVSCSAGTYIRTLAEDLGKRLGVAAHLSALRRTRAGAFELGEARSLDQLKEMAEANAVGGAIISPDVVVGHLPALEMGPDDVRRSMNGLNIETESEYENQQHVRLRSDRGELIGIGVYDATRRLIHPDVVFGQ